jgi:N-acetylmuramidase
MAFNETIRAAVRAVAQARSLEYAALAAVVEVESGGTALVTVDGKALPVTRWEGHYFHRRLKSAKRAEAVRAGLAAPGAGQIRNPAAQKARWRMIERAMDIDSAAALESASYGLGQVMGAHWKALGYASPQSMVSACSTVAGQVDCMARFIEVNGLKRALMAHDWAAFARRYNGPNYRVNAYDAKLGRAYSRHLKDNVSAAAPLPPVSGPEEIRPVVVPVTAPSSDRVTEGKGMPAFGRIAALAAAAWVAVMSFLMGLPCKITGWDYFCN